MSKAARKKAYILDKAKDVFMEKGFIAVTMKDIVDACAISRGGLYLYFSSTEEVFQALFLREAEYEQQRMEIAIWENLPAKEILLHYLEKRKEMILKKSPSLTQAGHEFLTRNTDAQMIRKWQFDGITEMLRGLIVYGIKTKEFKRVDAGVWARHIALLLYGLELTGQSLNLREKIVDEQIGFALRGLVQ